VLFRWLSAAALVAGCRDRAEPPAPVPAIELRDAQGAVTARVVPGHPCRATVDGVELLVGGPPLVAQLGAARWTGEDGANGTTLRKNDVTVARIFANQLFDGEGVPVLRVTDNGDITSPAGAVVAHAVVSADGVALGDATVTHTRSVPLAAMLAARGVGAEVRALAACHYLLGAP
jgi:hypothetical protein